MKSRGILTVVLLLTVFGTLPATAATPASGTVSETQTTVTWSGGPKPPTASATCNGPSDPACDNFALTILAPADPDAVYRVTITVTPAAADDWDLQVFDPAGNVAGSSGNNPGTPEIVVLSEPSSGTYTVSAAPFAGATYTGEAVFELEATPPPPPPGGDIRYAIHVDPAGRSYGEPSIGVNWNTEIEENGGSGMFISGLRTLRVRFDECTSPARLREQDGAGDLNWIDVSPLSHVTSLDPIIFTDPVTGRTFSSQLAGKTSLMESSDDDGENWLQCDGAGINSGVDHQTVGGGPLGGSLAGGTPLYEHGVYYCSQDAALAQCALSADGCRSFGTANPIYTLTECSGLHGHVKVAPDGTSYVPNKSCLGQQGVVVSEDNGLTWDVRTVPGSVNGDWDPSVGIGADNRSASSAGDLDHTVYIGYGDATGKAMAAASTDRGLTWSVPQDVGAAFGIRDTAFPAVVAGDRDRAAFMFYGTTTPNSVGDNPNYPAVWHVYVATTYDGGANWETVRVTGDDPVQRGTICDGGFNGCPNGTRNLLDFMDIQLDATGRPWVSYGDGCVGACVSNPAVNTLSSVSTIARQLSGNGLLSDFDAPAGPPATPRAGAVAVGNNIDLRWDEPNEHGAAITGYNVYRRTDTLPLSLLAGVGANARRYTDINAGALDNPLYEVRAVNSFGESQKRFPGCAVLFGPDGSVTGPGDACDLDGRTIADDAANDHAGATATLAHDILRVAVSEFPEDADGNGVIDEKLFTIMEVADLSTLPGNTIWRVEWTAPDGTVYFNAMRTDETALTVSFGYGWLDTSTGSIYRTIGDADFGTFSADGKIRIVTTRSKFDAINGPTGMVPGAVLGAYQGSTNTLVGAAGTGLLQTTDETVPDGYTLQGNASCLNRAPVAGPDSATTTPETAVLIDVLANDSDPDGDPISLLDAGPAAGGSVFIVGTVDGNQVEYTPNAGFTGTDVFEYTVGDDQGNTTVGNVTVTVTGGGGNTQPVANDDLASTFVNTAVTVAVLANDSDVDGDTLAVIGVSQGAKGGVVNNPNHTVTYTPNPGFVGVDAFGYSISDGNGGTASATVTVTVEESSCVIPGITAITDPSTDATDPTDDPSLELVRVSVVEPSASDPAIPAGLTSPLVIEIELEDFQNPSALGSWRVFWTSPGGTQQYWVGAEACDLTGAPELFGCTYGTFDGTLFSGAGDTQGCEVVNDNAIRITVEKSLVGIDDATDIGAAISGLTGRVQVFVGAQCSGLLSTVDSGGPGAYVIRGNDICDDACPDDPDKTAPGVCGCGVPDDDSDGDGTADCIDGCPTDAGKTDPGICGCGVSDADGDGDGTADCNDSCPTDAGKTDPGICGCGVSDADGDGDGTLDCNDGCPADPGKTDPGVCGCGTSDTDGDGDGALDCNDGCPADPDKIDPGDCGCGAPDTDSDGDGAADCVDNCPFDDDKTEPGDCGCGTPEGQCSATGNGRVHGSGFFHEFGNNDDDSDSDNINFTINARYQNDGTLKGKLKLKDRGAGVTIEATTILTFGPGSGTCNGLPTGAGGFEFTAEGTFNGAAGATFRVCGEDLGNPGNNDDDGDSDSDSDAESQFPDRLYIECLSGCSYDTASRTADDVIDGGNIHVRGPIASGAGGGAKSLAAGGGDDLGTRSADGRVLRIGMRPAGRTSTEKSGGTMDLAGAGVDGLLTMPQVLELDPLLLTELPAGTPLVLTTTATSLEEISPEGRNVTLRWSAADGTRGKATAVVDALGVAVFPIAVQPGNTVYHVRIGRLGSNRVVVTGL